MHSKHGARFHAIICGGGSGTTHEADKIYHEARLRRSEVFGEANTSAHTATEPTKDDEGIDDFAQLAENFSEDCAASEEVASYELSEPTVMPEDEAATSAEATSACVGELEQPSKKELVTKPPLAFAQDKKVGH